VALPATPANTVTANTAATDPSPKAASKIAKTPGQGLAGGRVTAGSGATAVIPSRRSNTLNQPVKTLNQPVKTLKQQVKTANQQVKTVNQDPNAVSSLGTKPRPASNRISYLITSNRASHLIKGAVRPLRSEGGARHEMYRLPGTVDGGQHR